MTMFYHWMKIQRTKGDRKRVQQGQQVINRSLLKRRIQVRITFLNFEQYHLPNISKLNKNFIYFDFEVFGHHIKNHLHGPPTMQFL